VPKTKPIEFFVSKTGCHICTSHSCNALGYHYYKRVGGKRTYLHRHIYEECFGFIPEGMVVRHTCDNPHCINPEHLLIGTPKENAEDMVRRNRTVVRHGEASNFSKLTTEDVAAIRAADKTIGNRYLAKIYGVTHSNISAIRLGKSWKHASEADHTDIPRVHPG